MNEETQSSGKMGRPVKLEGDKHTRERIFDSAVELFSRNGYNETSVRMIASATGITEGAVYRHYSGKDEILASIFTYAEKFIFSPLPIEQSLGGKEGESIFSGLLSPLPEMMMMEPFVIKIIRIIYNEMPHNEKISNYFLKEYIEKGDYYISELFRKCIEKGTIKPCDPIMLAKVFNSFRSDWAFRHFILRTPEETDVKNMKEELQSAILFFEEQFLPADQD